MLFYFTATGNSLYVAKQFDDQRLSIAQAIHDKRKIYSADKIGIVCPIYGHQMPSLVRDFLTQAHFQTDYFYIVLTYGNRQGGAPELAEDFLASIGIHADYLNMILMPDAFLPEFDMDVQKRMDKKTDAQIAKVKADIQAQKHFLLPVTNSDRQVHQAHLRRMAELPQDFFQHFYHITDDCIGCSICTKICPKHCFSVKNQKSHWQPEGCIHCMACIQACPMLAIQLNVPEKNPKARYRNENIDVNEIIAANDQRQYQDFSK